VLKERQLLPDEVQIVGMLGQVFGGRVFALVVLEMVNWGLNALETAMAEPVVLRMMILEVVVSELIVLEPVVLDMVAPELVVLDQEAPESEAPNFQSFDSAGAELTVFAPEMFVLAEPEMALPEPVFPGLVVQGMALLEKAVLEKIVLETAVLEIAVRSPGTVDWLIAKMNVETFVQLV
jgi:hypothetical protein